MDINISNNGYIKCILEQENNKMECRDAIKNRLIELSEKYDVGFQPLFIINKFIDYIQPGYYKEICVMDSIDEFINAYDGKFASIILENEKIHVLNKIELKEFYECGEKTYVFGEDVSDS